MLVSCESRGTAEDTGKEQTDTQQETADGETTPAPDFELYDQYGVLRRLSDYKGKAVFLNFWATWCPPCHGEMPDIQALYDKYGDNGEVAILGVAFPNASGETDAERVKAFLSDNGYTYPVVMDEGGTLLDVYRVVSYPTTFMISPDGSIFGYVTGALTQDIMQQIIDQTLAGKMEAING